MELDKFFTYVSFDIIGEVTFSKPFGFMDRGEDVDNSIANNTSLQIFFCTFGFYQGLSYLVNNPLMTWLQMLPVGHIVNTSIESLEKRKKNPDASFDIAAHWFRGVQKAKKDGYTGYTDRHILPAAVSNLGAGSGESCMLDAYQRSIYVRLSFLTNALFFVLPFLIGTDGTMI